MDPVDIFGETLWQWIKRIFLYLSSMVLGGSLGEVIGSLSGIFRGKVPEIATLSRDFLQGPEWIIGSILSSMGIPLIALLCVFVITSWSPYWWWFTGVAMVSSLVIFDDSGAARWGVWLVIMITLAVAVQWLKFWHRNRWAAELAALGAENAVRRAYESSMADLDESKR
ncbi:hypothetical protein [Luteolibacter soli]|uniref:Uncharacterized protein n=1 Tax=Luteolibacter soli TaxID=3135280 RepID=A0ABU9B194_9BACT